MRQKKNEMLAYFAMMLVEKRRKNRSIFVKVVALYHAGLRGYHGTLLLLVALTVWGTALPRYAAITCRTYCVGVRCYHTTLLLFPTSLHKSIVPCGGTGLRRYAVPSLLN